MHNIIEIPAWERLFKKIVWKQIGNLEGKKILVLVAAKELRRIILTRKMMLLP